MSSSRSASSASDSYLSPPGLGAEDWGGVGLAVGAGDALGWFLSPDKFRDCCCFLDFLPGIGFWTSVSCDRSQVCNIDAADLWDLFVKDWVMEFLILSQDHIHILKRKHLGIFSRF